jgi:hypothetical protein
MIQIQPQPLYLLPFQRPGPMTLQEDEINTLQVDGNKRQLRIKTKDANKHEKLLQNIGEIIF